jgi:hypothetical protein
MPLSLFSGSRRRHSRLEDDVDDVRLVAGKENSENRSTTLEAEFDLDGPIGLSLGENNTVVKRLPTSQLATKLRVGDRIIKVDGKDCAEMSVNALLEGIKTVCRRRSARAAVLRLMHLIRVGQASDARGERRACHTCGQPAD